jgi:hypothetical protein
MAQAALIETGTDLNRGAMSEISTALRQILAAARLGLPGQLSSLECTSSGFCAGRRIGSFWRTRHFGS